MRKKKQTMVRCACGACAASSHLGEWGATSWQTCNGEPWTETFHSPLGCETWPDPAKFGDPPILTDESNTGGSPSDLSIRKVGNEFRITTEAECDETPTAALSRACLLLATTTGLLDIETGRPEVRRLLIDAEEHVQAAFGEVQAALALVDQKSKIETNISTVEAQREH